MDIKDGIYKGRGVKRVDGTWASYGDSDKGTPQIVIDLNLKLDDGRVMRLSCPLYFSAAAKPYSDQRLRALGWKGTDYSDLTGLDTEEVNVEIKNESYDGKPQIRVNILTGGGGFSAANPMDGKTFNARMAALSGAMGTGAPGGDPGPPF